MDAADHSDFAFDSLIAITIAATADDVDAVDVDDVDANDDDDCTPDTEPPWRMLIIRS